MDFTTIVRQPDYRDIPPSNPEKRLRAAVLARAFNDLTDRKGIVRLEARNWFSSNNRVYTFSFYLICESLDFDIDILRNFALGLYGVMNEQNTKISKQLREQIRRIVAYRHGETGDSGAYRGFKSKASARSGNRIFAGLPDGFFDVQKIGE